MVESIMDFIQMGMGRIILPKTLKVENTPRILHLADTPGHIFPAIKRLIETIKPQVIIHTGDLVDDIKLELYPGQLERYKKELKVLAKIIGESGAESIISIGNHDDEKSVKAYFPTARIISTCEVLEILGISFAIGHKPREVTALNAEIYCYGHSLELPVSPIQTHAFYANGIHYIYVFEPEVGIHYKLNYPSGTNDYRLCKRKTGF